MVTVLEKFANSNFMNKLRKFSERLTQNPTFSTISVGMSGTLGIIMFGAVIQIILALGGLVFGWQPGDQLYEILYMPYKLSMGLMGLFMAFSLAYNYSKRLKSGSPIQSGFTAIICFILIVSPVQSGIVGEQALDVLNLGNLGSSSLFIAMIIGLVSVRISKIVIDNNLVIKLPEVVPEGVIESFNAIIPTAINIIFWYGLTLAISSLSGGTLTLSTLIMLILGYPINFLVSPLGMVAIVMLGQLFWFFGIHGTSIIMSVIMVPFITAYMTNAELAAAGQPLVFSAVFLFGANGIAGGTGNTLALTMMGLRSKSKQIKAISKASFVPGLFGINEPTIFGFPIMYNPLMLIPFLLAPIVVMGFMALGYYFNLLAYPQVLIFSVMPVGLGTFLGTLSWRNAVFAFLMIPVSALVYYPFYKAYEKQLVEQEAAAELELAE